MKEVQAMGIVKPTGGYVEQMLGQAGWPEVDEDTFYDRARALTEVLRQITEVLATSQHQRAQIFDGGIWSGGAAEAANSKLGSNVDQLITLQDDLAIAITWHQYVAGSIVQAKSNIGDNVEAAQRQINALENDRTLTAAERTTAINTVVSTTHGANVSVVADTAEQIRASQTWKPPNNALTDLLDQKTPPPVTLPATPPPVEREHPRPSPTQSVPVNPAPVSPGWFPQSPGAPAPGVSPTPAPEAPPAPAPSAPGAPDGGPAIPVTPAATAHLTRSGVRHERLTPASATQRAAGFAKSKDSSPPVAPIAATGASPIGMAPAATGPGGKAAAAGSGAAAGPAASNRPPAHSATARAAQAPTRNEPAARPKPTDRTQSADAAAMALIPVSAARAARDAAVAASIAGPARRSSDGTDPLQLARRIAAALNAPGDHEENLGFFWVTAVTTDGAILVANSYGLAYIPDGMRLPQLVTMVSADAGIPAIERARWATFPVVAVQGWAAHHNTGLRAVIATEEQFGVSDPGVAKVVLELDDIPSSGAMTGRSRLEVVDPAAAARLAATADPHLIDLLPPALVNANPSANRRRRLWFEVMKPMASSLTGREAAHLRAFHAYAAHAQDVAVDEGHTAPDPPTQRSAVADWLYWKHLTGLLDAALADAS
ncbi:hypothetical protein MLAC_41550 [Mycobacterium lacus]|uniref:Secretion protein EspK n=2 Tax=Mycobacterium lacus TaxID=169765 RepID=A0A7I7NSS0_9MYCO|nr:hypothetical protein MLAC_41550 [Mycobacterium lacus]